MDLLIVADITFMKVMYFYEGNVLKKAAISFGVTSNTRSILLCL